MHGHRGGVGHDLHPRAGRMVLLIARGRHLLLPTAVDDGDILGAQQLGLHGSIDGGHAAADDHHITPDRQGGKVAGLTQFRNEFNGGADVRLVLARRAQGVDPGQADRQEHRIILLLQIGQRQVAAKHLAGLDADAADLQQPLDLALRKTARRLVGGKAKFIEPPRLGPGVEYHDLMPLHRQPVRRRQARRPRPHHGHRFPRRPGAGKGMDALGHQRIGGKPLQAANLDRLALGGFAHAGLFAQGLGRADAGAHAAEDVLGKDRLGRRLGRAGGDLADEQRNVDAGGAGRHAGGIVAEIAAIGGHMRLVPVQRRLMVMEIRGNGLGRQAPRHHAGGQRAVGHHTSVASVWLASD